MTIALGLLIGLVIGLTLGALGGGGSILTVPALVYVLGENPHHATTTSLVVVGLSALSGMIGYARSRDVRWSYGLVFAAVGLPASLLGSWLSRAVDPQLLLVCFAVLMVIAAIGMLIKARATAQGQQVAVLVGSGAAGGAASTGGDDIQLGDEVGGGPRRSGLGTRRVLGLLGAGLLVGFLTGFLGVGGGFLIVPALTMLLGFEMVPAVATSLLVIAINSAVSFGVRVGHSDLDWTLVVVVTATSMLGSLAGRRVARRIPGQALSRGFAVFVILVAAAMLIKAVVG